ncbi:unnamed protein product [Effrenium voratum]|nr:unnamed protein product [Effrenium voratum]
MEPDTVPYDPDEAAWSTWQVPSYSACQKQMDGQFQPPEPAAPADEFAPTIAYETFADPVPGVDDGTLAYDGNGPGGVPQESRGMASAPQEAPAKAEAATLAYGDTLVLEPEEVAREEAARAEAARQEVARQEAAARQEAEAREKAAREEAARKEAVRESQAETQQIEVGEMEKEHTVAMPEKPVTSPAPEEKPTPKLPKAAAKSPKAAAKSPKAAPRSPKAAAKSPKAAAAKPGAKKSSGSASRAKSGLKRLWGKQPPPPGYVPPKAAAPKIKATPAKRASAPARPPVSLPAAAGHLVLVKGDGWGGGTGEYQATVVDADDLSLTVVYRGDDKSWKETHVLREHCTFLEPVREDTAKSSRRRTH